jgi:DNA-binding transcriptional regulator PaaX
MLYSLITLETRIKLLKKFIISRSIKVHLRGPELEFGKSSDVIRVGLNRFEEAGLLNFLWEGNKNVIRTMQQALIA